MKTLTGEEIQTAAAEKLNIDFASLIALTAIWAPLEAHIAAHDGQGNFARVPNCRRKRHFEPRGEVEGIIYDDNSRPNSQMKAMAKKYYGVNLQDFTVCHVWPDTCYDVRYHTCYANLVCIPAAIHSLTDYDSHVESCLKYRAYELFGWKPDDEQVPTKPENYPTEWLALPRDERELYSRNDGKHTCEDVVDDDDSKALARLDGVYANEDSIIHEIIQRAIALECSDVQFVFVDDLIVGRIKRHHIQSMKTERGNSYGRYFEGCGRGEEAQVCFVPEVWQKLMELNWVK